MCIFAPESDRFLAEDGLDIDDMSKTDKFRYLRQFVYEYGNV
jgi:hypothetical protein